MRRAAAAFLALVAVGVLVLVVVLARDRPDSRPPSAPAETADTGLLVGFFDDANFRWRPYRARMLDRVQRTGASVVRVFIRWHLTAPTRPRSGQAPFHEPMLHEIDELVANASARGLEVLVSIWGTPAWANGGLGPNHAPDEPDDLRRFARALASRYPSVTRYAIWNEPNTEQFLAPQFDAHGQSVAPASYARLYRAAYEGIKEARPNALVAVGETSSRGRDAPSRGRRQDTHSPARFARLLAAQEPALQFDAWGHHPYPVKGRHAPDHASHWPSVTLTSLERFGMALDRWFGRDDIPLWVTEYAHESTPEEPRGISPALQARYAAQALELAAGVPRVRMFVWFTFRDDHTNAWQSGMLDERGRARPAYEQFTSAVAALAGS